MSIPVRRRYQIEPDALTWEPGERWVRGTKNAVTVVDSRRPILVWEPGHPIPSYAFPRADVRTDLLRPARARDAALAGYLAFGWFGRAEPGLDHWYEEDEEVFQHPRNPFKRVDALRSTRQVTVEVNGVVAAQTRTPVLVFEAGVPTRYYIPREDVRLDLLAPVELGTVCPYKGVASDHWPWAAPATRSQSGVEPPRSAARRPARQRLCGLLHGGRRHVRGRRARRTPRHRADPPDRGSGPDRLRGLPAGRSPRAQLIAESTVSRLLGGP